MYFRTRMECTENDTNEAYHEICLLYELVPATGGKFLQTFAPWFLRVVKRNSAGFSLQYQHTWRWKFLFLLLEVHFTFWGDFSPTLILTDA